MRGAFGGQQDRRGRHCVAGALASPVTRQQALRCAYVATDESQSRRKYPTGCAIRDKQEWRHQSQQSAVQASFASPSACHAVLNAPTPAPRPHRRCVRSGAFCANPRTRRQKRAFCPAACAALLLRGPLPQ